MCKSPVCGNVSLHLCDKDTLPVLPKSTVVWTHYKRVSTFMWQRHIYRYYQKALWFGHIYKCVKAQYAEMCVFI